MGEVEREEDARGRWAVEECVLQERRAGVRGLLATSHVQQEGERVLVLIEDIQSLNGAHCARISAPSCARGNWEDVRGPPAARPRSWGMFWRGAAPTRASPAEPCHAKFCSREPSAFFRKHVAADCRHPGVARGLEAG